MLYVPKLGSSDPWTYFQDQDGSFFAHDGKSTWKKVTKGSAADEAIQSQIADGTLEVGEAEPIEEPLNDAEPEMGDELSRVVAKRMKEAEDRNNVAAGNLDTMTEKLDRAKNDQRRAGLSDEEVAAEDRSDFASGNLDKAKAGLDQARKDQEDPPSIDWSAVQKFAGKMLQSPHGFMKSSVQAGMKKFGGASESDEPFDLDKEIEASYKRETSKDKKPKKEDEEVEKIAPAYAKPQS